MRDFPVSGSRWLTEQAARWERGELEPAAVALASTVMLVRADARGGESSALEVFLQRRVASMEFAPSMLVFPGGRVDPRDARTDVRWAGRSPRQWAEILGVGEDEARELVTAAVRELFEECGVLLAGPDEHSVVADVSSAVWHERRMALTRHEISLAEVLSDEDLVLRSDLLAYRAHWVTPVFEPRRYDTRFFAAAVPEGQVPDAQTSEADHADWADPAATVAALDRGEVMMLPPTRVALEDLAVAGSVTEVVTDAADVIRVMPELVPLPDGLVLRTPLPAPSGEPTGDRSGDR
ncbi:NUDIX hydrolase [Nostocoides sp. F2B08]|uniref:NUDIX hydrolase n=1 Tax=Nostocoides sp. F2B08 TaxID=2653936 RepID=UPI001262F4AE|nr:NUDIX hydrolase [Tetrasphaera sp. F2B08]KAB7746549.1 NUDIX hydrolase [Tetrasphaera sp. F2B08]